MAASFNFNSFMGTLDSIGFYTVALPFLLIFTIIFAILEKIKLFGPDSKRFNGLIAMVMAFLVIRVQSLVEIMNNFLPQVSFLALIFIVFLLLVGILVGPTDGWKGIPLFAGIIVTIGVIVYALLNSSGMIGIGFPSWLQLTGEDRNMLIAVVLFFVFVWFVVADGGKKKSSWSGFTDYLEKLPGELGKK